MTTPATLNDGTTLQYGMGIKIGQTYGGRRYIGHGGSAPGFRAEATWYPTEEMAVVVLMNTSPTAVSPGTVAASLARRAHDVPRPAIKFYTDDPTPFVGIYEHGLGRDRGEFAIEVAVGPNGLTFSRNGSQPRPLPWAGELTFYLSESVTLTFSPGDGNGGTMTELRRDTAGNHDVLRKR